MEKQFLYVPFEDMDELIELGGRWDKKLKKWYVNINKMTLDLEPYMEVYVDIPYDEKDRYKERYSIRWDPIRKSWFTSQQISEEIDEVENLHPSEYK
jgi:hypothetical protein